MAQSDSAIEADIKAFGTGERRLSSRKFNELRAALTPRTLPTLWDWQKRNEDLSSYDLSNARFPGATFEGVVFGNLQDVEFSGCRFEKCDFAGTFSRSGSLESEGSLSRVVFFECTFSGVDLSYLHLKDVQLTGCKFVTPPKFVDARVSGRLKITSSGGQDEFAHLPELDLRLDDRTSFFSDISVQPAFFADWSTIRFLRNVPFMQISSIGFILLVVNFAVVEYFAVLAEQVHDYCVQTIGSLPRESKALETLESICRHLDAHKIFAPLIGGLYLSSVLFLVLFFAALIQTVKCPSVVYEYSINQWRVENKHPKLFYELSCQRNYGWILSCALLYAVGGGIFAWISIKRFLALLAY